MTEARTADLWLKIDQLHLRFLQVVFMTKNYLSLVESLYYVVLVHQFFSVEMCS